MTKLLKALASSAVILCLPSVALAQSSICPIDVGVAWDETVSVDKTDFDTKISGNHLDASLSTFRVGTQNVWTSASVVLGKKVVHVYHAITRGKSDDPTETVLGEWAQNEGGFLSPHPNSNAITNGHKWITNSYQSADGILLFVHAEYTGVGELFGLEGLDPPGKSQLGLAWIEVKPGTAWWSDPSNVKYLGHVIAPNTNERAFNIHGTPYVVRNENNVNYFYVYFHDTNDDGDTETEENGWGHIGVARAPVNAVIDAAKLGQTSVWQKYNNGSWTNNALNSPSSNIIPTSSLSAEPNNLFEDSEVDGEDLKNGRFIIHSDAAQDSVTGRYVLTGYLPKNWRQSTDPTHPKYNAFETESAIVIYDSCDGVNWKFNRAAHLRDSVKRGWSYLSIVDVDGTDNATFSGEFDLLAGFELQYKPTEDDPSKSYDDDRRQVSKIRMEVPNISECGCP